MIPYCPACEAWSNMILPVNDFLESFPAKISVALRQKLEVLWEMSNALSQDAFHCDDFEIFHHSEWERLRVEADAALQMIGWDTLKDQVDELMLECRKALYPHFYQGKT